MFKDLDIRDTTVMRGLAITAIVFHNYFHLVSYSVNENEFTFDPARFWNLVKALGDPVLAVQGMFSFFGHFGVQVFVFLSAFGLAKSHWDDDASWGRFLWGRIRKLYPVIGLVILPWLIQETATHWQWSLLREDCVRLFWTLAGVSNLLVLHKKVPPIGPWWFIPFIVQFYAFWPLMRRFSIRFGRGGLIALSMLSPVLVYFVDPFLRNWSANLIKTPAAHLPEVCLGIIAARYPMRLGARMVLPSCLAVVLGSMYRAIWPLSFVAALILFLAIYQGMRKMLRASRSLAWIGQHALLIFLVNGIVRLQFLQLASSPRTELMYGFVSAVTSLAVAALIQGLYAGTFPPGPPQIASRKTGSAAESLMQSAEVPMAADSFA
jgi:peptidoglycan/LPS O-acetylase OafA/YrhL